MEQHVPFYITSGLPYGRTIVVTLPSPRDWWLNITDFEVLGQIREAPDFLSPLLLDLTQFMTFEFTAPDTLTIDLRLTGSDTRLLKESGHYDIVMSDVYAVDDRAVILAKGEVYRTALATADVEDTNG